MRTISAETPGILWKEVAEQVCRDGATVWDGDKQLKEVLDSFVVCGDPTGTDTILERHADRQMIQWMLDNFLEQEPVLDWGYSYGERFFNYSGINQIESVIAKLRKNPESKSATISLMNPKEDQGHVPCICAVDFKLRGGKLRATAFFRSQDAGKKLYADMIALGRIMALIAGKLAVGTGELGIFIASLHVYEEDIDSRLVPLFQGEIL